MSRPQGWRDATRQQEQQEPRQVLGVGYDRQNLFALHQRAAGRGMLGLGHLIPKYQHRQSSQLPGLFSSNHTSSLARPNLGAGREHSGARPDLPLPHTTIYGWWDWGSVTMAHQPCGWLGPVEPSIDHQAPSLLACPLRRRDGLSGAAGSAHAHPGAPGRLAQNHAPWAPGAPLKTPQARTAMRSQNERMVWTLGFLTLSSITLGQDTPNPMVSTAGLPRTCLLCRPHCRRHGSPHASGCSAAPHLSSPRPATVRMATSLDRCTPERQGKQTPT